VPPRERPCRPALLALHSLATAAAELQRSHGPPASGLQHALGQMCRVSERGGLLLGSGVSSSLQRFVKEGGSGLVLKKNVRPPSHHRPEETHGNGGSEEMEDTGGPAEFPPFPPLGSVHPDG
jgi:hypothetical protein